MSYRRDLLADFDADLKRGAGAVFDEYVEAIQTDPAMPYDVGNLQAGIKAVDVTHRPGRSSAVVTSTARSKEGADYGTILDLSTGKKVGPKRGGGAFGPFRKPVQTSSGPTRFLASFHVTTKHVGWWKKVNSNRNWADALRVLGRFRL